MAKYKAGPGQGAAAKGMICALCPHLHCTPDAPGTGLFHLMPVFFSQPEKVTFRMTYIKKLLQLGWEGKMQGMCMRKINSP